MGIEENMLVVIATLNEYSNLPSLTQKIRELMPSISILVVDDNSSDGTVDWLANYKSVDSKFDFVVRHDQRGLGSATIYGMNEAIHRRFEWVATMDADWSHDPMAIKQMIDALSSTSAKGVDVCIGSRYVAGGKIEGWPVFRRFASKATNFLCQVLLGLKTRDNTSALRVYRVEKLIQFDLSRIRCQGFGYLEELLFYLNAHGATMREFPITFKDREHGASKATIRQGLSIVSNLFRLAAIRLRGQI